MSDVYNFVSKSNELVIDYNDLEEHFREDLPDRSIFYIDSGVANAYALSAIKEVDNPIKYATGLRIRFYVLNNSTGASTVDVAGLGARKIFDRDGLELIANSLRVSVGYFAEYDETLDGGAGAFKLSDKTDDEKGYDYIVTLINGVEGFFYKATRGRNLLDTTYETYRTNWCFPIKLIPSPTHTIDKIEYLKDGSWVLLDSSNYYLERSEYFSKILLEKNATLPSNIDEKRSNIKITFTSGYATSYEDIKVKYYDLYVGLLHHITALYSNRGDCFGGKECEDGMPPVSEAAYNKYKMVLICIC